MAYIFLELLLVVCVINGEFFSPSYQPEEKTGTLAGDVQNWAIMIQNYISQVCVRLIMVCPVYFS